MSEVAINALRLLAEDDIGPQWTAVFEDLWPEYRQWFLSEGEHARPTYLASLRALKHHMPEIVPTYERAVELAGGSDLVARMLSGYRPPPFIKSCSQAIFRGESPMLIRNYDYSTALWEAMIARTSWNGRRVIGMSDCLWGLLDGVNDAGLAVSLAFGGRRAVGDGFGIPIIVRYVLEFCASTAEAISVLCRVPSHMSYNVTVLDGSGDNATVMVAPDRQAIISREPVATNHQVQVEWKEHALATDSVERLELLSACLADPSESEQRFVQRFLESPVYSSKHALGLGTLYTAIYRPALGTVSYLWPEQRWDGGLVGALPALPDLRISE